MLLAMTLRSYNCLQMSWIKVWSTVTNWPLVSACANIDNNVIMPVPEIMPWECCNDSASDDSATNVSSDGMMPMLAVTTNDSTNAMSPLLAMMWFQHWSPDAEAGNYANSDATVLMSATCHDVKDDNNAVTSALTTVRWYWDRYLQLLPSLDQISSGPVYLIIEAWTSASIYIYISHAAYRHKNVVVILRILFV